MANRSRYDLVDRILGGRLAGVLAAWKSEGVTFDEQANLMQSVYGVKVTRETLRRWSNANATSELDGVA